MSALAGLLRERAMLVRPDPGRDDLAGIGGGETVLAIVWAGFVPDGDRRWRVALRPTEVAVGDRIVRVNGRLAIDRVLADPRMPDRITLYAEELP